MPKQKLINVISAAVLYNAEDRNSEMEKLDLIESFLFTQLTGAVIKPKKIEKAGRAIKAFCKRYQLDISESEIELIKSKQKMAAIRSIKQRTYGTLKECKEIFDRAENLIPLYDAFVSEFSNGSA